MSFEHLDCRTLLWSLRKQRTVFLLVLFLMTLHGVLAIASPLPDMPIPPPPDPALKPELVCRYIYISYADATDSTISAELIDEVPSELEEFMDDQANGLYTFDIQAVTVPGNRYQAWMADYVDTMYTAHYDSLPFNQAGLASGAIAEAHTEILTKILASYEQNNQSNPLLDCDYLFFIHSVPIWGSDRYWGDSNTGLNLGNWQGILSSVKGFHTHRGTTGFYLSVKQTLLAVSAHEFGHNMGMNHPNYWGSSDGSITFGAYDAMRTPWLFTWDPLPGEPPTSGLIPYGAIQLVKTGWIDPINVTEEEHDLILYDYQSDNRNVIVIPIENCGGQYAGERFVLSYHDTTGYDKRHNSNGLQIWHDLPYRFSDVEAAKGRWSGDLHDIPDPESGVDPLDWAYWDPNDLDPNHNKPDYKFEFSFPGNSTDFFNVNDTAAYPDGVEFSYNTNPSTYASSGMDHQDPQSLKTTLFVRARPRNHESIYVDVFPMPREDIVSPVNGESVAVGDSMVVSWEHEFYNQGQDDINVLDQVKIWFSPYNGAPYSYLPVGTADYSNEGFVWHPAPAHVTTQGKIKLEFTNDVNGNTTETIMDGSIAVTGSAEPWEVLIAPAGGETLFANESNQVRWTNYNGSDLVQVDVEVSTDSGTTWQQVGTDVAFTTVGQENIFSWTPSTALVGGQTLMHLLFHFAGGTTDDGYSEGTFSILDAPAYFVDVSSTAVVDYEGTPYAAADLDYNIDTKPDMFVTIQECDGCDDDAARSRLFRNIRSLTNPIHFTDRTAWDFIHG